MREQPINRLYFKGTRSWNSLTLAATAVVDGWLNRSTKKIKLTAAATHYITAGSAITINGTDNYDGTWKTLPGTATTLIYIDAPFVAETTSTGDTVKFTLAPGHPFELVGLRLTLVAAADQAENLIITVTSGAGSSYDCVLLTHDTSGMQHLIWQPPSLLIENGVVVANQLIATPTFFAKDDEIDFSWPNAGNEVYGLEVQYRRSG